MRAIGAVGGDDDGVLDAHAADAGEVDAGLDGDDVTGRQGITAHVAATRGASWISRPTPWPVPCDERVAPAGVDDDVAARRGRPPRTRRRRATASRPRLLARSTTSQTRRASGPGSPTLTVRVMSEQ